MIGWRLGALGNHETILERRRSGRNYRHANEWLPCWITTARRETRNESTPVGSALGTHGRGAQFIECQPLGVAAASVVRWRRLAMVTLKGVPPIMIRISTPRASRGRRNHSWSIKVRALNACTAYGQYNHGFHCSGRASGLYSNAWMYWGLNKGQASRYFGSIVYVGLGYRRFGHHRICIIHYTSWVFDRSFLGRYLSSPQSFAFFTLEEHYLWPLNKIPSLIANLKEVPCPSGKTTW